MDLCIMVQVDLKNTSKCQPYAAKEGKNDVTEIVLSYLSGEKNVII